MIGTVKKVTRDRDGLAWLRFHTARALEKHDGLQFEALDEDGRHLGLGISEMRQAISRRPVFEVNAGVDVEILLPEETRLAEQLKPGMKIYCSMSNAVKRMFPTPSFRPSDYEGGCAIDVKVRIGRDKIEVVGRAVGGGTSTLPAGRDGRAVVPPTAEVEAKATLTPAHSPEKTEEAVRRAFAKLGGTGYRLASLVVEDPEKLFAPASLLNDLRRDLVEKLDDARAKARREKIEAASFGMAAAAAIGKTTAAGGGTPALPSVKLRIGQAVSPGDWGEVVVAINAETTEDDLRAFVAPRLSLPVYTSELVFNRLRNAVKRLRRAGYEKWECADLATLRLLRELGVADVTADWTLYAFNSQALATLAELGVTRFVASPENGADNLQYLAESGYDVAFLAQQSTPLFISLTPPAPYESDDLVSFRRDGLWVTTKRAPRTFTPPKGAATRLDLSWDPPAC